MKVLNESTDRAKRFWRTSAAALTSALVAVVGLIPTPASAITRDNVLSRAQSWVKKKVRYSQSSYFAGYRRDCSGFVSMAWRAGRSYTSSTIRSIAKRIPISHLKPGDAVHTPGHVAIFVRWKNKARGIYVAMEETSWGRPAARHVRKLGRNATALRYRAISEPVLVAGGSSSVGSATTATATPSATGTSSAESTPALFPSLPSLLASGSIESTLTALRTDLFAVFELPSLQPSASVAPTTRLAVVPLY